MIRDLRHLPWFAAFAALCAASFAGCGVTGTDTSEAPEAPGPGAEAAPAPRSRLERWRATFPGALAGGGKARFERSSGGAFSASPRARVELPASSDHEAVVTEPRSGVKVAFALQGGGKVALALDGDLAIYAGAGPEGADVLHRARPNGTEDLVAFEARPASESLAYAVDVRAVAGLRLVARTLEMLDAKGSPRLRVAPPFVIDARGVRREASISVGGCAFSTDPRAPWGRPVVPPGAASCTVVVRWDGAGLAYPVLVDPVWESADDFVEARTQAAYAELTPGAPASQVLFTGGFASGQVGATALKSAEIYFPLERAFAKTADMTGKRGAHTATLLDDGTVLVAGGLPDTGVVPQPTDALTTMERYDVGTGTFAAVPIALNPGRALHTATLLTDGSVLFAGGTTILGQPTISAVRFDPIGPGFTALQPMVTSRAAHTASLLRNGKVLLTGGFVQAQSALLSAELFEPAFNTFAAITPVGAGSKTQMAKARAFHVATQVDCRTILISGGTNKQSGGVIEATGELYLDDENPTGDADCPAVPTATVRGFSPTVLAMTAARSRHTATRIPTGDVVLVGGTNGVADLSSTEIFKLLPTPAFAPHVDLGVGNERRDHAAILVNAGATVGAGHTVLVAGGTQGTTALPTALVLAKNLGEPCSIDAECESGFCPAGDGLCCNTACGAECYSCTAATQAPSAGPGDPGPTDGTCRPEKESDGVVVPGQLYPGELPSECNTLSEIHFKCDGTGLKKEAQTIPCLPGSCGFSKKFCETSCNCNDEAGNCDPDPNIAKKCFALGYCDLAAGQCQNKGLPGTPCEKDYQCFGGKPCVDGVCCNSPCTDQCAACNLPSSPGICSPIGANGPTSPLLGGAADREPCLGDGTSCSGFCNGSKTVSCDYPGEEKQAGAATCECADAECAAGPAVLTHHLCNGDGGTKDVPENCGAAPGNDLGGLKCAEPLEAGSPSSTCLDACAGDKDCFDDFYCDTAAGTCEPLPANGRCNEALDALRKAGTAPVPCGDYVCKPDADGPGGTCPSTCQSKADCSGELFCNTDGKCVATVPAHTDAPACSAAPGRRDRGAPVFVALALGALALLRARRRASSIARG